KLYFDKSTAIEYDTFINDYGHHALQEFVENGDVKIHYQVKSQETKRYETIISTVPIEILKDALKTIPKQATKQKELIDSLSQHTKTIGATILNKKLCIARDQIKT